MTVATAVLSLPSISSTAVKNGASSSAAVPGPGPGVELPVDGSSTVLEGGVEVAGVEVGDGAVGDVEVGDVEVGDAVDEVDGIAVSVAVPATGDPAHAATTTVKRTAPNNWQTQRTDMIRDLPR